ncbi:DUF3971 domain-containing protein [Aquabacter sp. P-9]|uniref:YhdP family protein n=1 Tax=Aquabacter sediminis TaxID=3029197 RepID=UPI00237ECD5C|nr:DUF3971 domain-containing protein [Aquabacter sp. P-9]MDE1569498.1 DUF3971 domain-containing protein [Aquabacter sp. P-9]
MVHSAGLGKAVRSAAGHDEGAEHDVGMSEESGSTVAGGRHLRRGHVRGLAGALVPRGRFARILVWSLVWLVALAGALALGVYGLVATGVLTANMATPYVERAIEARLGGEYDVQIGAIAFETMKKGSTALVVRDIRVLGPKGELIASAPSAEVEMEGSILTLSPKVGRLDLIGAEMFVKIAASGSLAVSTGKGAKPITSTPVAPAPPVVAPAQSSAPGAPAVPAANGAAGMDPLVLRVLAQWMEDLDNGVFDGGALREIGIRDATVEVENESNGRRVTFDDISISLNRPDGGGAVLTFSTEGPSGTASLTAGVGPVTGNERSLTFEVKNVETEDLVHAFTQDWKRFYMDMPLNASVSARIARDGRVLAGEAHVELGAGQIGNGEDPQERFVLDYMKLGLKLDPARRIITIDPLGAGKNANIVALTGEITVPATAGAEWPYVLRQQKVLFAGPEMPDPPLVMDTVSVTGRYVPADKRLMFDTGTLAGPTGSLTFAGMVDFGMDVPTIKLNATGSRMPASTVRRFWPVSIAPPARAYVLENLSGGTVDGTKVTVNMPIDLIGQKEVPLPEDAVHLEMTGSGFTLMALKGLPPLRDMRLSVVVTGRSVRVDIPEGTVVTPQNRKLAVSDGVFFMPDYFPREPKAQVRVKFAGPADAGVEILGMDALKGPTGTAYDPATTRGKVSALVQINIHFRKVADPTDTDYSVEATLTDFGLDNVFAGQRVEGATVSAFATPAGILLRGDGKIAGAPMNFEYEKRKDVADADIKVNATLDDSARGKLGVNLPAVSGPVLVRLVGTTNNKDTRANIELDLTNARISDLVPGLTKPAGKPLKAKFASVDSGSSLKINDLTLEGSGTLIKGSLELSNAGEVNGANFPVFQISDGDKASLKADRAGDVLKVKITGEVIDARGIMKSLMSTPATAATANSSSAAARREQRQNRTGQDVDVEAKIGALTGNHGEVLRQMDLSLGRRGVELRSFQLSAKAGRDGTVAGEIRGMPNGKRAMLVTTSDAGAVLRFLDVYPKIDGGEMWVVLDPPRSDPSPQEGTLNLRDFVVRGEPGLAILSDAARDSSGKAEAGTAVFQKAQAKFTRTPGAIAVREAAIWGPVAGVTLDGSVDFIAERIGIRGTYVPAYGLNNLFSKLPVIGALLGGGPNEGLVGVTFEIVGPLSGPRLTVNPLSAVAPGFLRKMFEFRDQNDAPPVPPR